MHETNLMVFHIGPVQDFIISARRSRDLWFGSWLLGEISKAASEEIVRQNGGDVDWSLIFPAPQSLSELRDDDFNVANRIVARTRLRPDALGEAVRKRAVARLHEIKEETFRGKSFPDIDFDVLDKQVDDLLEVFWASCPLDEDYPGSRRKVLALMAARKNTRNFEASTWGSSEDKSSLDGKRESVIPRSAYKRGAPFLWRSYGIRRGERLCGIGLLKRHGERKKNKRFASSSHVAAQGFLQSLTPDHKEHVDQYIRRLKDLGLSQEDLSTAPTDHPVFGMTDGHLLYEERLSEFLEGEQLESGQAALRRLINSAPDGKEPTPYYVLLQADGDHMGKVIDAQTTIESHRSLTRAASGFAKQVAHTVNQNLGSLIYAGGDDVLAMLPCHTALACAKSLADEFSEQMAAFDYYDKITGQKVRPSLSTGLAIVHHLEPLSDALDLVRRTERRAKQIKGKNALAITLNKRSGTEQTIADTRSSIEPRLRRFIGFCSDDRLPAGLAYELRELSNTLEGETSFLNPTHKKMLVDETRRIAKRKRTERGAVKMQEEVVDALVDALVVDGLSVGELATELIIAKELAPDQKQPTQAESRKEAVK